MNKVLKPIYAYTGETIKIEVMVYDNGVPADLSGASSKIAIRKVGATVNAVEKSCSVDGSIVYATLTATETLVAGSYKYEVRISKDGEPDSLGIGELFLTQGLIDQI